MTEPTETISEIATRDANDSPRKHVKWGDLAKPENNQTVRDDTELTARVAKTAGTNIRGESVFNAAGESRFAKFWRRLRGESADSPTRATCRFDEQRHRLIDFTLPDLSGRPVRFADLNRASDYVLLDFWNVADDPSAEHFAQIAAVRDRYGPAKVQLAAIAYEAGPASRRSLAVISTAKRLGSNSALLFGGVDAPCPLQSALHVQEFPTLVLLDRRGQVLWRSSGSDDKTLTRLDRVLAANIEAKQGTFRR